MIFAKVIGTVVSTSKDPNLEGKKLLLCKEVDHNGKPLNTYHVAVDAVQAGEGSFVLISYGSSARMTELTKNAPVDAVIMAIIDEVQITEKGFSAVEKAKGSRK
ncbi:ethanolamine utilization protein EutN [candidate division KSB1 bacterium]|jgi:microcompartment protein CcmK/EutM|nr:MAG: ethanolamine utilization protein EutN [candidate division KSB1 bacterium]